MSTLTLIRPLCVNLAALLTRLLSTCRSRLGSPITASVTCGAISTSKRKPLSSSIDA